MNVTGPEARYEALRLGEEVSDEELDDFAEEQKLGDVFTGFLKDLQSARPEEGDEWPEWETFCAPESLAGGKPPDPVLDIQAELLFTAAKTMPEELEDFLTKLRGEKGSKSFNEQISSLLKRPIFLREEGAAVTGKIEEALTEIYEEEVPIEDVERLFGTAPEFLPRAEPEPLPSTIPQAQAPAEIQKSPQAALRTKENRVEALLEVLKKFSELATNAAPQDKKEIDSLRSQLSFALQTTEEESQSAVELASGIMNAQPDDEGATKSQELATTFFIKTMASLVHLENAKNPDTQKRIAFVDRCLRKMSDEDKVALGNVFTEYTNYRRTVILDPEKQMLNLTVLLEEVARGKSLRLDANGILRPTSGTVTELSHFFGVPGRSYLRSHAALLELLSEMKTTPIDQIAGEDVEKLQKNLKAAFESRGSWARSFLKEDPDFRKHFDIAVARMTDQLQVMASYRNVKGILETVTDKHERIRQIQETARKLKNPDKAALRRCFEHLENPSDEKSGLAAGVSKEDAAMVSQIIDEALLFSEKQAGWPIGEGTEVARRIPVMGQPVVTGASRPTGIGDEQKAIFSARLTKWPVSEIRDLKMVTNALERESKRIALSLRQLVALRDYANEWKQKVEQEKPPRGASRAAIETFTETRAAVLEQLETVETSLQRQEPEDAADLLYNLGLLEFESNNFGEAAALFSVAANRGNASAQYALAHMYEEGNGVPKNLEKATQLYTTAKEKGSKKAEEALLRLSGSPSPSPDQSEKNEKPLLGAHDTATERESSVTVEPRSPEPEIGSASESSTVDKDDEAGDGPFSEVLEGGNREATTQASITPPPLSIQPAAPKPPSSPLPVSSIPPPPLSTASPIRTPSIPTSIQPSVQPPPTSRAPQLLANLKKSKKPEDQLLLGTYYEKGTGVEQNFAMAAALYGEAARQGNTDALFNLGRLFCEGKRVGSPTKGAEILSLAAEKGHVEATYLLARLYEKGIGVMKKSLERATTLYTVAANRGHEKAKKALQRLQKKP